MSTPACDAETGICTPDAATGPTPVASPLQLHAERELIYVGDPMCSWCWGIAPALEELRQAGAQLGLPFSIVVGGLRASSADAWTAEFRQFLRHHWEEVHARTGQPFSYGLLDSAQAFAYITEPACRAVVAARALGVGDLYGFFKAVQRRFYVDNADPGTADCYTRPCAEYGLDAASFVDQWQAAATRQATQAEFALAQSWGVRGFPTVLLRDGQQLHVLAGGYATADAMLRRLHALVG